MTLDIDLFCKIGCFNNAGYYKKPLTCADACNIFQQHIEHVFPKMILISTNHSF